MTEKGLDTRHSLKSTTEAYCLYAEEVGKTNNVVDEPLSGIFTCSLSSVFQTQNI